MIVLYIFIIIFVITPFLPATENPHWFFRTADFVRLQSLFLDCLFLVLFLFFESEYTVFSWILLATLIYTIGYEIDKVFKYSSFYPRKKPDFPSDGKLSILAGNVLQTNTYYDKFLKIVKDHNPDLVLTMESNSEWEKGLSELEETYPYTVKVPKENFYGMHLYSKIELINPEVKFQVEEGMPSIFFEYPINKNKNVFFCCLHPAPPSPTENETSKERDAELMITGNIIRELDKPTVVCGDMNDVVWSRTTRLFKKMTAMIDPRIGRGFFSTYHAKYFFMRFPLDHLFHTKDLFVKIMERTENFGSDHFAMYYEIHHKKKEVTPKMPKLNGDDNEEVKELIEKAE